MKPLAKYMILAALALSAGAVVRAQTSSNTVAQPTELQHGLREPYQAPEFEGIETWLNSKPLTMQGLKGKVVLVDFWTYSCVNCVRTLPHITRWDRDYRDKGLVIVGVHAPEFDFEKNVENVKQAIQRRQIAYPVAMDNHLATWDAYHNRYWPAHYLINPQGQVVYTHFGEGDYEETENNIRYLLGLKGSAPSILEKTVSSWNQSPETYLGYRRADRFVSPEPVKREEVQRYSAPTSIPSDSWALQGAWNIGAEHITAEAAGAALQYRFTAAKVFLVLGSRNGKPLHASLTLDEKPLQGAAGKDAPDGMLTIRNHTLYELVNQGSVAQGLLTVTAESPGLEAYAFTFGSD